MLRTCFSRLNLAPRNQFILASVSRPSSNTSNPIDNIEIPKPTRTNESLPHRRARLLYQSRKRGMLENDLLLSTFADKYLHSFTPELIDQYDKLINEPSNDWDLYYWLTGKEEPPAELNNEVFSMLKDHTQNKEREVRCRQPPLRF